MAVDAMVCDVKEREGCTGKIGRESKRETVEREGAYVDDWSGSGERISIHCVSWLIAPERCCHARVRAAFCK